MYDSLIMHDSDFAKTHPGHAFEHSNIYILSLSSAHLHSFAWMTIALKILSGLCRTWAGGSQASLGKDTLSASLSSAPDLVTVHGITASANESACIRAAAARRATAAQ